MPKSEQDDVGACVRCRALGVGQMIKGESLMLEYVMVTSKHWKLLLFQRLHVIATRSEAIDWPHPAIT